MDFSAYIKYGKNILKNQYDEDNRLMVLSDNGKTSRYTYNHAGERAVKSHGSMEGVYINGAPQGITFHETDEYTLYPASIISVNKNRYTKHYFIGNKRIASRIGSGSFNNVYGQNGSFLTAGQQDYAERINQIETQREDYYRELGIAPGVPTMKGSYGDPENTGVGYNTIIKELGDHTVPAEWAQYVKHNEVEGSTPGAPIQWDDPSDPESAQPGYGFVADNSTEEETFYYHSDHLGSTSYITDGNGNITQYDAYLPYGELLVDEHSSSEEMPYKFNGKELDEETGLYYYGARYMQPMASIWYGVDPLTEKYPNVGGYVYCNANPVKLIDPDGMDWKIHTSKGRNGKTNVSINFSGVIVNNSSNKHLNLTDIRDKIKQQIISRYSLSSKKYNVKMNVDLRVVNSVDEISTKDIVFDIVNQNVFGNQSVLANSDVGGMHIRIGPRAIKGLLDGTNTRTIPHEVGHSAGLLDANIENNGKIDLLTNLMTQTGYLRSHKVQEYTKVGNISDYQIERIISKYKNGELNRNTPIGYRVQFINLSSKWIHTAFSYIKIKKTLSK